MASALKDFVENSWVRRGILVHFQTCISGLTMGGSGLGLGPK